MSRAAFVRVIAVAILVLAMPPLGGAQRAGQSIRFIATSGAGATLDLLARAIADGLPRYIPGAQIVVENRVGGGGNIGAAEIARGTPDGSVLGMISVATHGINPSLYGSKLPFDPIADFVPITIVAQFKTVMVIHPSIPAATISEFVAYAKANPGKASFGSAGAGTSLHLSGELFNMLTGTKMIHVPYRGVSQAMPDLLSGRVQMMFVSVSESIKYIRSGELRAIGVTSKTRDEMLPDVAPIADQGYPDFYVTGWFGVAAPKGTPIEIVRRYNTAIQGIFSSPEYSTQFTAQGIEIGTGTPEHFAAFIKQEIGKWKPVVEASGAQIN